MEENIIIFGIGFLAQLFFFSRMFVQWFISEKAGKVLSPTIFWQISLLASLLMMVYGILRLDLAILLGQILTYIIYIRNLQLKGDWEKIAPGIRFLTILIPIVGFIYLLFNSQIVPDILNNPDIPKYVAIWGIVAQIVFTFRFVYQWIYSEKKKESQLPAGFWIISITGASMIILYALYRKDPVLLAGSIGGIVVYSRNLYLLKKQSESAA